MTTLLRAALLFVLGLAAGLAWETWQSGSLPFGIGAAADDAEAPPAVADDRSAGVPAALDRPLPGPDWGRATIRASTGRLAPIPAAADRDADSGDPTEGAPAAAEPDRERSTGPAPRPEQLDPVGPLWSADDDGGDEAAPWTPAAPADTEVTVPDGGSLSQLAYDHYGFVDDALVAALAEYNGLDNPDRVRAGQQLFLPALEALDWY